MTLSLQSLFTLTLNYENIPVSFEDGLAIAYQEDDGIWYWPGNISRDKNQKTVSVQTTHFSDWTLFESMHLAPGRANVEPNEELELIALRYLPENDISKLLTPLVQTSDPVSLGEAVHLEQKYIKEWTLIGEGILTPTGSTATYLAPANIPDDNPVTVSLEINLKNGSKDDDGNAIAVQLFFPGKYLNNGLMLCLKYLCKKPLVRHDKYCARCCPLFQERAAHTL